MNDCKYYKNEVVNGRNHEICSYADSKDVNKFSGKNTPCMKYCGRFEKINLELEETQK